MDICFPGCRSSGPFAPTQAVLIKVWPRSTACKPAGGLASVLATLHLQVRRMEVLPLWQTRLVLPAHHMEGHGHPPEQYQRLSVRPCHPAIVECHLALM